MDWSRESVSAIGLALDSDDVYPEESKERLQSDAAEFAVPHAQTGETGLQEVVPVGEEEGFVGDAEETGEEREHV